MIDPKQALKLMRDHAYYLEHNHVLMDIFEGNLLPYILKDLQEQLSGQQFDQAKFRCTPINTLPKVIDKLTNIYQTSVLREVVDGTDSDKELLKWYEEKLDINETMNSSNELFNLCKFTLIHPYVNKGVPKLRLIQNDRGLPNSSDPVEPCRPTDVVIAAGKKDGRDMFWVYGEDGFYVVLSDETIDRDAMAALNNPEGVNPFYPRLPFVYAADSKYKLIPTQDTDVLPITKIVPIMLTDLNLAAMYQAFSILFGIDVDEANITLGPGVFLRFKSDATTGNKPEIGTIKPTVDFQQVLGLIQAEFGMWLQSKGIRPGAVGQLTAENFASGISKMIDEMDTYEARQKQVTKFTKIEAELWDLILHVMHPYWVQQGMIENQTLFSPGAKVKTSFAVQLPMQSRGVVVKDLKEEVSAGFTTRKRAIQKLNPEMSQEDVENLINEIEEERNAAVLPESGELGGNDNEELADTEETDEEET